MTSALSITRSVNPPRAAFLDFPLGHTTGKPHDPALQRAILAAALDAFARLGPGEVEHLPFRWSDDDAWRDDPLGAAGGDARRERAATPQYQAEDDRLLAERRHGAGATCATCVGADGTGAV